MKTDRDRNQEKKKEKESTVKNISRYKSDQVKKDLRYAAIGGGMAAVITLSGAFIAGKATGGEAYELLLNSLPSARAFSGNVLLATGTILALMLTLLSFSYNTKFNLNWVHYQRIKDIALADTITLIFSILVYLLLNVPLEETDLRSADWFAGLYYSTLILSSLLGGCLITVVLMLYQTIKDMIYIIGPGETGKELETDIIIEEESEE